MRRIITALLVLLTTSAIAQNGGQITGKKNSGLTGTVMVDSVALKVSDSASRVYLSAMKLKSDSIYKRMYQDSVNLAKLGTGVTTTLDSATQRGTMKISNFPATQAVSGTFWQTTQPISGTITTTPPSNASSNISQINGTTPLMGNGVTGTGSQRVTIASDNTAFSVNTIASATDSTKYRGTIQVSNFPATQPVSLSGNVNTTISGVAKKTLGTAVVSADTGLVVNAVMHGITTGGGGTYVDVKVNPSGALTVEATLDSATQRSTIQVSGHDSTTDSRLGVKLLVNPTITNDSSTLSRTTIKVSNFPATQAVSFTRLKASTDTVAISGTITSTAGATTIYDSTYASVQMDTAGLGAMANSATVGWQSDSVGLRQWKCTDVKIGVKISMANTAPANDKAVYVYVYPMWYDGSTWYFTSGGTTTFPSGANSTYTIASPNNLRLLGVLSYTTTNMVLQDQFVLSNAFGSTMPDAFGLVIVDFSGAAIHTTNHRIYYSLINKVQR